MAQSVASTAAKASYTQTMSPSVLTPPPLVAVKKDAKLANNWKTKSVDQLTDEREPEDDDAHAAASGPRPWGTTP